MAKNNMHCIRPGLWLGNREAASNKLELKRQGVTRLLTTVRGLILPVKITEYVSAHLVVPMDDDLEEDLLINLSQCLDFLMQPGAVLVHCMAGISRSVSVVMAYLMHTEQLTVTHALDSICQIRQIASPNVNFLEQLEIYESMGAPKAINLQHRLYRSFVLTQMAEHIQTNTELVHHLPMAPDPFYSAPLNVCDDDMQSDKATYRCSTCRRVLFCGNSVLRHLVPSFKRKLADEPPEPVVAGLVVKPVEDNEEKNTVVCQRELFVEPIEWMRETLLQMQSKLLCPKCNAKLGACSWLGVRCGCRRWISPSIHVHQNKVDRIPVLSKAIFTSGCAVSLPNKGLS